MANKSELKIGQRVYYKNRNGTKTFTVVKLNPKRAKIQDDKGIIYICSYGLILTDPNAENPKFDKKTFPFKSFQKSNVKTGADLIRLKEEVLSELRHAIKSLFTGPEKEKLKRVKIHFKNRLTYSNCGTYYRKDNRIGITKSLMEIPEWVIKSTIWHELLHVHFKGHGPEFRRHEAKYERYSEAKAFESELLKEIRYRGMTRINQIPKAMPIKTGLSSSKK